MADINRRRASSTTGRGGRLHTAWLTAEARTPRLPPSDAAVDQEPPPLAFSELWRLAVERRTPLPITTNPAPGGCAPFTELWLFLARLDSISGQAPPTPGRRHLAASRDHHSANGTARPLIPSDIGHLQQARARSTTSTSLPPLLTRTTLLPCALPLTHLSYAYIDDLCPVTAKMTYLHASLTIWLPLRAASGGTEDERERRRRRRALFYTRSPPYFAAPSPPPSACLGIAAWHAVLLPATPRSWRHILATLLQNSPHIALINLTLFPMPVLPLPRLHLPLHHLPGRCWPLCDMMARTCLYRFGPQGQEGTFRTGRTPRHGACAAAAALRAARGKHGWRRGTALPATCPPC